MAVLKTNFANAFRTTLVSEVADTDLVFPAATVTDVPSQPYYIVFEPRSATRREVIKIDSDDTSGSSLRTTVLGNRYLAGSAAGSGITHPAGAEIAIVPVAQMWTDLHDRVDDLVSTTLNLNVFDVTEASYGAVADSGSTDNEAAFTLAFAAATAAGGGIVYVPPATGFYGFDTFVELPSNVHLYVPVGAHLKQNSAIATGWFRTATAADNIMISGHGLIEGSSTPAVIESSDGATNITIKDVTLTNPSGAYCIKFEDGVEEATIDNVKFDNIVSGVRVRLDCKRVKVVNCDFGDWATYGVEVRGTGASAPEDCIVSGNTFHDVDQTGTSKQAVATFGVSGTPIKGFRLTDNSCTGPGLSHASGSGGTGDQFSLQFCEDFVVSGNTSIDGGENGFSIVGESSFGVVANNVATGCFGHGIQVGISTKQGDAITVTGNTAKNNGQDTGITSYGILCSDITNLTVSSNVAIDTGATQNNGIGVINCPDMTYGLNETDGNVTAGFARGGTTTFAYRQLETGIVDAARFRSASEPVFNVKHTTYGAVGDGATDDTTAIQAAIDAAEAAEGEVYFPPGDYLFNSQLLVAGDNVKLTGAGYASKLSSGVASGVAFRVGQSGATVGFRMENLWFEGGGGEDVLFQADYTLDGRIRDCKFTGSSGIGVELRRPQNVLFDGCEVRTSTEWGIKVSDYSANDGQTLRIVNCTVFGNDVGATGTGGIWLNSGAEHIIRDCQIEDHDAHANSVGIRLGSFRHEVTGCVFELNNRNVEFGVSGGLNTRTTHVHHNKFVGGTINFINYGYEKFQDNIIEDRSSGGVAWGVTFGASATNPNGSTQWINNVEEPLGVANSRITDNAAANIIIYEDSLDRAGTQGFRQTFTDLDTTPDVRGARHFLANNTGATTITNFDGGYNGKVITIRAGNGDTTLQDAGGGSLRLAGSVNYTLATSDIVTLVKDGSLWYETSRSVN